jgi:adenylate kinase family enzyme
MTASADLRRTLIIGNAGSGKTWLAGQLAALSGLPVIHLDDLRWTPGQYGKPRDNQLVMDEVARAAEAEAWLMEGVFGWLAKVAIGRATQLIWLDLPEDECLANVRARGIQGGGSDADFEALLTWVGEYRLRDNSSCFAAHLQLFEAFEGTKARLMGRNEMAGYLGGLR